MKKVLALVLAVVMVCTMAFALTPVAATPATGLSTSGIATLTETSTTETYGVEIDPAYYVVSGLDNNVFTASNVTLAKDDGKMYVVVPTLDKALDGVADFTFTGTLKIADKNNAGTYVICSIKNGVLVATEGKQLGITMTASELDAWNGTVTNKLQEKYDIGFETYVLASDADLTAAINGLTAGDNYGAWYITGNKALSTTINDVTVKVPAKTAFKMKAPAAANTTDLNAAGLVDASYTGFTGLFVEGTGITMSLNVTPANNTMNFYAIDNNGKVYSLGTSLTESKKVDGSIVGTISATFGGTYQIVKLTKSVDVNGTVPGVAAAPAGSTTTNPGTGANDVVGVAAALAVVALVSGAAISLKK